MERQQQLIHLVSEKIAHIKANLDRSKYKTQARQLSLALVICICILCLTIYSNWQLTTEITNLKSEIFDSDIGQANLSTLRPTRVSDTPDCNSLTQSVNGFVICTSLPI